MSKISNRFREIRENKKMTITALAAAINENRQRLQDIELGKQKVPEDIIVKYIDYFDIDANWLLTGRGGMYKEISIGEPGGAVYKVYPSMSPGKLAELAEGLSEDQRLAIAAIIEDKKRLNELEAIVMDLQIKIKK